MRALSFSGYLVAYSLSYGSSWFNTASLTTGAEKHCLYLAAPDELPLVAPDEAAADFVGQIQIANLQIKPFKFLAASRQGRPNVALRRDSSLRRCFRQSFWNG